MAISVDEEITLMDWGNAVIKVVNKGADGSVTGLIGVLHLEGSVKTTKLKLLRSMNLFRQLLWSLATLVTKKKVFFFFLTWFHFLCVGDYLSLNMIQL
ncbi:putative glutamate--tRNA ligase [Helianthus annuus]|nr:putative glutamate--tRNA ligase [Helianthus annuus]